MLSKGTNSCKKFLERDAGDGTGRDLLHRFIALPHNFSVIQGPWPPLLGLLFYPSGLWIQHKAVFRAMYVTPLLVIIIVAFKLVFTHLKNEDNYSIWLPGLFWWLSKIMYISYLAVWNSKCLINVLDIRLYLWNHMLKTHDLSLF